MNADALRSDAYSCGASTCLRAGCTLWPAAACGLCVSPWNRDGLDRTGKQADAGCAVLCAKQSGCVCVCVLDVRACNSMAVHEA